MQKKKKLKYDLDVFMTGFIVTHMYMCLCRGLFNALTSGIVCVRKSVCIMCDLCLLCVFVFPKTNK